jgi:hypothetical protein
MELNNMSTTTSQITIFDCTTGETIIRDATNDELNQIKIDEESASKEMAEAKEKEMQKAGLLERLGITADEAKLLLQ